MKTIWIGLGILLTSLNLTGCKEEPEHASACKYITDKFDEILSKEDHVESYYKKATRDIGKVAKDAGLFDLQKCPNCVLEDYVYEHKGSGGFYEFCIDSYVLKNKGA